MAKKLFLKESQTNSVVPDGFVSLSNQGGELKTGDSKGTKPVSATGEKFVATGSVYEGELVYLNSDGTVSVPGNVTGDDNKADNIIGIFLSDAEDAEVVSVITKGIISLDSFDFLPRTVYYITTDGKLTTSVTPYIFGKSLSSTNIMIDISFMQSILNRYGVTPTFDRLTTNTSSDGVLNIYWSSNDEIYEFSVPEYGFKEDFSGSPLTATASIDLSELIESESLQNGTYQLGVIKNADDKTAEFKFQIIVQKGLELEYKGFGGQYQYDGKDESGIFNDFNYFDGVNVSFLLFSDKKWIFGTDNIIPLRKLFGHDGVKKDTEGNYVVITIKQKSIKLYETGDWDTFSSKITSFTIPLYSEKGFYNKELFNFYLGDVKSSPDSAILIYQLDLAKIGTKDSPYNATLTNGRYVLLEENKFSCAIINNGKIIPIAGISPIGTVVINGTTHLEFDVLRVPN